MEVWSAQGQIHRAQNLENGAVGAHPKVGHVS